MSTMKWSAAGWLAMVVLIGGLRNAGADEEAVFDLHELSVFEHGSGADRSQLTRGQSAQCQTEPDERVKVYPKFNSKRPLYGSVKFGRGYLRPDAGVEFHFAIDESGSAPASMTRTSSTSVQMPHELLCRLRFSNTSRTVCPLNALKS